MKPGWVAKRLGDFATTVSTGPFGSLLHKSDYVDHGVPLVNPINVVGDRVVPDRTKLIGAATKRREPAPIWWTANDAIAKGTARDNINLGTFESQRFPFPPLKRQEDIVTTLNALHEETQSLAAIYQRKLAALDALRKTLLHQAFSGQL